ncbi:MAG: TrkH family potassium uptake protein [Actinobacteria bacterium]|nr:TrkH family potassium uptake protein [Actinomycetota bacterium]MCL5886692.1 TrkH family potassium uptake protein [Actinomycetota bacterium]
MTWVDTRIILYYTGLFVFGIAAAMAVPLVTGIVMAEWNAVLDYLVGISAALVIAGTLRFARVDNARVTHTHAMILTASGWLAASLVAAIPLSLSPAYASYLDALFDSVSGLTTSGLTVVTGLDHMAHAHNMWRHLTHLIGGQGIVVAAISLSIGLRSGAFSLYVAEGRDERIMPNVIHSARFIWYVTAVYVLLGTVALTAVNFSLGMEPARGVLHAFWISMAAYDTGGFAPQSMNALYYHSFAFEIVTLFLMIGGMMNFNLHAQVWRGDKTELWRNIETKVLATNVFVLSSVVAIGLAATAVFNEPMEILRKGMYHVISAHSGTGHQTLYAIQWFTDYGGGAAAAIILAMAAGGAVSSTAGGIKALRLGMIIQTIIHQIKLAMSPRSAIVTTRFHHLGQRLLTPEITSAAAIVFILYVITYITGALIGVAYGYGAAESLFESISATANVGLSAGITSPDMPAGLKYLYMFQMWAGRLEFIAVFVLMTQVLASVASLRKGKK